mmetsp:Transcript_17942/g.32108  ORF Transcript_17942/g.32108 Transcript_17942/m.32108 type:complete len:88 (+) Transcript_17942:41-304(+)
MRKYTKKTAESLGITGWVQNTDKKSVQGEACGRPEKLESFKKWLSTEGSPKAEVEKAEFTEEKIVTQNPFKAFEIRKVRLENGSFWA